MRRKDYIRLSKISLAARKKSTRNTVLGIVLGLVLIVPVVFFTLSFYVSLGNAVNESYSFRTLSVPVCREEKGARRSNIFTFGQEDLARIRKERGVEEYYFAEYYEMNGGAYRGHDYYSVTLNGYTAVRSSVENGLHGTYLRTNGIDNAKIKVIDLEQNGGRTLPSGITEEYPASFLYAAGEGFTGDGKGQVILSRPLVTAMGFEPQAVIGKSFTLTGFATFSGLGENGTPARGYYLDDNSDPADRPVLASDSEAETISVDVLCGFTVVGVIDGYYTVDDICADDAHIWICRSSAAYEDGRPALLPALTRYTARTDEAGSYEYQTVTYPEPIEALGARAAAEKLFFPAVPVVTFSTLRTRSKVLPFSYVDPVDVVTIQCKSFAAANRIARLIDGIYAERTQERGYSYARSMASQGGFGTYQIVYEGGSYILTALYVVGGTVLFATFLNLFNSVNYSVQVRRNYLGMMRAIGADAALAPRLYFTEVLLILRRSFLIALPFAGIASLAAKLLTEYYFHTTVTGGLTVAALLGFEVKLSLWYFLAAVLLVFLLFFSVALLFAYVACRRVMRDGITQILATEE